MDDLRKLENKMVRYRDLINIKVKESGEPFVDIGNNIIVRKSVYRKLNKARSLLSKQDKNLSLYITCGYRSLEVQTEKFLKRLKEISTVFFNDSVNLYEEVHRYVAVPTVAGHPTGGAVDIMMVDNSGKPLDFGSKIYDYSTKNGYVFSENISQAAQKNRLLLREIMVINGFAPFDGEWWHFSYGDREWAYYYKKPAAIYDQIVNPFQEPRSRRRRRPI